MKMPEKHDPLAAILAAKEQGIGAILCVFAMRTFAAGRYNGGAFTKSGIDANRQLLMPNVLRPLDFAGLSSNLAI